MKEKTNPPAEKPKGFRRAGAFLLRHLPMILALLFNTAWLTVVYEFAVRLVWQPMFWIYFIALAGLSLFYVFFNRGFTRTRVSREQLPGSWSEQEKDEFFASAERRRRLSYPLLAFIIPLALVFVYDTVALFFGDFIENIFPFIDFPK